MIKFTSSGALGTIDIEDDGKLRGRMTLSDEPLRVDLTLWHENIGMELRGFISTNPATETYGCGLYDEAPTKWETDFLSADMAGDRLLQLMDNFAAKMELLNEVATTFAFGNKLDR